MISKLQQAGSCPAHRLWPGRQLEVLTGLGQERYPAHGLWPGLARPRARIPTASGRGSRQGCSRLKAGVSDKKQSKHISNYFELICFVKKYLNNISEIFFSEQ